MNEFFAIASFFVAAAFVAISLYKLIDAKFNALFATMLGMGGLVLVDIGKYYYLDQKRVGWIGDETFQSVSLMIWLSCAAVLFSYFFFTKVVPITARKSRPIIFRARRSVFLKLLKSLIIPISFSYSFILEGSGFAGIISGGLLKGLILALFIYGIYKNDKAAILVSITSLLVGVDDSSRRAYIAISLPVIVMITFILKERIGRINFKTKFFVLFLLLSVFVFLNAIRSSHNYGEGFNPENRVDNTIHYMATLKSVDTFYNTSYVFLNFPSYWEYYYGETYLSVLVAPIPRSIWQDKPVSLGAQLGLMQTFNFRGFDQYLWEKANMFSLSPGFVGEAYVNFGYRGVLLASVFLGLIMAVFDKRLIGRSVKINAAPWVIFLSAFVLIHRGDFYVSVNYQIFMFLAAMLFMKFFFKTIPSSKLNNRKSRLPVGTEYEK